MSLESLEKHTFRGQAAKPLVVRTCRTRATNCLVAVN